MRYYLFIPLVLCMLFSSCEKTQEELQADLIKAVINGDTQEVEKILENGVDPSLADETGKSAFDYAIENKDREALGILINYGGTNDSVQVKSFLNSGYLWSEVEACRYHPFRAFDGNPLTSWIEGNEGPGLGASLRLELDQPVVVDSIRIMPGFFNRSFYQNNNRVRELAVVQEENEFFFILDDTMEPQVLNLDYPVRSDIIEFRIEDYYKGDVGNNTCIAEIELYFLNEKIELEYNEKAYLDEENQIREVAEILPAVFLKRYSNYCYPEHYLKIDVKKREIREYRIDKDWDASHEYNGLYMYFKYKQEIDVINMVGIEKTDSEIIIETDDKRTFKYDTTTSMANMDDNYCPVNQIKDKRILFSFNVFYDTGLDFPAEPDILDVASKLYSMYCSSTDNSYLDFYWQYGDNKYDLYIEFTKEGKIISYKVIELKSADPYYIEFEVMTEAGTADLFFDYYPYEDDIYISGPDFSDYFFRCK